MRPFESRCSIAIWFFLVTCLFCYCYLRNSSLFLKVTVSSYNMLIFGLRNYVTTHFQMIKREPWFLRRPLRLKHRRHGCTFVMFPYMLFPRIVFCDDKYTFLKEYSFMFIAVLKYCIYINPWSKYFSRFLSNHNFECTSEAYSSYDGFSSI